MVLVPGERLSARLEAKLSPSVKRRWEDAHRGAILRREVTTANEFVDKLLEGYEKAHAVGRSATPFR